MHVVVPQDVSNIARNALAMPLPSECTEGFPTSAADGADGGNGSGREKEMGDGVEAQSVAGGGLEQGRNVAGQGGGSLGGGELRVERSGSVEVGQAKVGKVAKEAALG